VIIIGDDDQHAIPVLRVQVGSRTFATVTIEEEPITVQGHLSPADVEDVQRFIQLNRSILLEYWYLKIRVGTLGEKMQKINDRDEISEGP
jgi:hypothetical protein